jgi:hypothetical protein
MKHVVTNSANAAAAASDASRMALPVDCLKSSMMRANI